MNFELIDKLIELDVVDSTQTLAKEMIKENPQGNILVLAHSQKKGYGRRGNIWSSCTGGIYFTLISKMDISNENVGRLSIETAKVIKETLKYYKVKSRIKKPNDVYAEISGKYKKISGILIDVMNVDMNEKYILFGVGVNTNNKIPEELPQAVSLSEILGRSVDNNEFLKIFFNHFWKRIKTI